MSYLPGQDKDGNDVAVPIYKIAWAMQDYDQTIPADSDADVSDFLAFLEENEIFGMNPAWFAPGQYGDKPYIIMTGEGASAYLKTAIEESNE